MEQQRRIKEYEEKLSQKTFTDESLLNREREELEKE